MEKGTNGDSAALINKMRKNSLRTQCSKNESLKRTQAFQRLSEEHGQARSARAGDKVERERGMMGTSESASDWGRGRVDISFSFILIVFVVMNSPKYFIQLLEESVQNILFAEVHFLFRRLSSLKSGDHVTLFITVR